MARSLLSEEEFSKRLNAIAKVRFADQRFGDSELSSEMGISRFSLHRKVKEAFVLSATYFTKCFHAFYGFPPGKARELKSIEIAISNKIP
ncbi:MAG: hypothetical protein JW761_07975 [Prolixibacteraceae bacterium]|nr:hypothetical protein [Prolixibacteraceae bacterium]